MKELSEFLMGLGLLLLGGASVVFVIKYRPPERLPVVPSSEMNAPASRPDSVTPGRAIVPQVIDDIPALHRGARDGSLLEVRRHLLLDRDSVNNVDNTGRTPLHYACYAGNRDIVEFLITEGADVNAPTRSGVTPLDCATFNEHAEVMQTLKLNGAHKGIGIARRQLSHRIEAGDTMEAIAAMYGSEVAWILEINPGIAGQGHLKVGQQLQVPFCELW